MKKFILLCLTMFGLFFNFNVQVKALEYIDKNKDFATCTYSSDDGLYQGTFYLYKYNGNNQNREGFLPKNIKITKFAGNTEDNWEADKGNLEPTALAIVTGECPKYLTIAKGKNNNAYYTKLDNNYESAKAYIGGNNGAVLTLTTDYLTMLKSMENFHNYLVKKHTCTVDMTSNPFCINGWRSEQRYICDWGNGLSKSFSENYKGALSIAKEKTANISSNNICPFIAYEITKGSNKYYKYGGDWPEICKDDGITCSKYNYGGTKEEYLAPPPPPEPFSVTFSYATRNLLTYEFNEDDIMTVTITGKNDGTVDNIDVRINNQSVSLASYDHNKFKDYLVNFAKSKGTADPPNSFECSTKDKMIDHGYTLNNEFSGLVDTSTYCTDTVSFGYSEKNLWGSDYYFLYDKNVDSAISNIRSFMLSIDQFYNDNCVLNDDVEVCSKFQENAFVQLKKIYDSCRKIYVNKDSIDDDIQLCDDFKLKVNDWAEAGYFGNRIITGDVGTDCDAVLGSLGEWLTKIYKILLLAVPVIIVAFGFKDFIKALTVGKEDELKKAGSTFIKRLIFGAVFVALPIIVKVILTLALGGDLANICIL